MRLALGGLSFELEGDLTAQEALFCARHADGAREQPAFALGVSTARSDEPELACFRDQAPARVEACAGGRLRVTHRRFVADLDMLARRGQLRRRADSGGLEIALRVALCARLPAEGGLPLHAAGIVHAGQGLAFFGVSGAGKSTLAASAPGAVLSDELIVLRASPWRVLASGFWGECELPARESVAPLQGLYELAKTRTFELGPLAARTALRRLLACVLVPPDPALWNQALLLAARLTREVPAYRLGCALGQPPWRELSARAAVPWELPA